MLFAISYICVYKFCKNFSKLEKRRIHIDLPVGLWKTATQFTHRVNRLYHGKDLYLKILLQLSLRGTKGDEAIQKETGSPHSLRSFAMTSGSQLKIILQTLHMQMVTIPCYFCWLLVEPDLNDQC